MGMRRLLGEPRERDGEGRFLTGSVLLLLLLLISALLILAIDDYRHYSSFNSVFDSEDSSVSHAAGARFRPLNNGPYVMDGFKEFILARDVAKSPSAQVAITAKSGGATTVVPPLRDETLVLRGTVIPGFALFEYKPSMRQSIFHEGDNIFNRGTLLSVDSLSARVDINGTVFTYKVGSSETRTHIQEKVAGVSGEALKQDMKKAHRGGRGNDYANLSKRTGVNE